MDKIFQVKQKTVKGLIALIARTGLLQVIAVVATFVLTVFLDPAQFGVFAIVAAAVDILVYFFGYRFSRSPDSKTGSNR